MCGIAGVLGPNSYIKTDVLSEMAMSLAHRGPDDEGIMTVSISEQTDYMLGLVHRRLSIIDLSNAAHQPMEDKETGNWIVYNGEVYNYREIRSELENRGCIFRSQSDTETILKAFNVYGINCLEKLRGMFAFVIWDQQLQRLFFAVDRFGIKPLYYYQGKNGKFVFASELRTILKSGFVPRNIEPLAVDSYLSYGAIQAPLTMIKNVYALLPAQCMVYSVSDRKIQIFKYWNLTNSKERDCQTKGEHNNVRMRELLEDSVEKHLVSDVPVGLFLSGGIDSSTTVILANKLNRGQLRTFSVSFPESTYSESQYSNLIADRFCRHHTEINLTVDDLVGFLPDAVKSMDQPTIDGVNVYTISKAVRETGIKVVLSGQGGDEIFGGYSTFKRVPIMLKASHILGLIPKEMRQKMASGLDSLFRRSIIGSKYSQILDSEIDVFAQYSILRQLFSSQAREYILGRRYNHEVTDGVPSQVIMALKEEMAQLDNFSRVSLLELRLYLSNMLLRDGDCMSMAHGLEVRVPLLDHEIAEFVFSVDSKNKVSTGYPKPLLVNAMRDLLPEEIYMRSKMGFTFPWELWLRDRLRSEVEETIYNFPNENELGLNMENCRKIWSMFCTKAPGVTWSRIWAIYVLLKWYKEHVCF